MNANMYTLVQELCHNHTREHDNFKSVIPTEVILHSVAMIHFPPVCT